MQHNPAITVEQFDSVLALQISCPRDFLLRLDAKIEFQKLSEASALSAANKRVANILKKQATGFEVTKLNENLFEHNEERELAQALNAQTILVAQLVKQRKYTEALSQLSVLKMPIDAFFDKVMVMVEDPLNAIIVLHF